MKDITTIEDMKDDRRRFLIGRDHVLVDAKDIALYGLDAVLKWLGVEKDNTLLPVFWCGEEIGTLVASWMPETTRTTLMYDPRASDFIRVGDTWVADKMLGPGDLLHAGVNFTKMPKPAW